MEVENEISYKIRGAIFNVYNNLGPGLLESAYEIALRIELEKLGCKVQTQVCLPIVYEGVTYTIHIPAQSAQSATFALNF